jgi:hexosaminidase
VRLQLEQDVGLALAHDHRDGLLFPLELDSVPQLAAQQAFSRQQVYTKADVADIVKWGRLCGVRVMPEIDVRL